MVSKQCDPDQTPCSATSDLSLQCLPGTLGKYCLNAYVIKFSSFKKIYEKNYMLHILNINKFKLSI